MTTTPAPAAAAAAADEVQRFLLAPDCRDLGDAYALAIGVIFRAVAKAPAEAAQIVTAVEDALDEHHYAAGLRSRRELEPPS